MGQTDVGNGTDFGVDLYALYRAGHYYVPEMAVSFAELSDGAREVRGQVDHLADSVGSPRAMRHASALLEDLHTGLYQTFRAMDGTGETLVSIATDYAATDGAAAAKMLELLVAVGHDEHLDDPTPVVTDRPTSPSAPVPDYEPPADPVEVALGALFGE